MVIFVVAASAMHAANSGPSFIAVNLSGISSRLFLETKYDALHEAVMTLLGKEYFAGG